MIRSSMSLVHWNSPRTFGGSLGDLGLAAGFFRVLVFAFTGAFGFTGDFVFDAADGLAAGLAVFLAAGVLRDAGFDFGAGMSLSASGHTGCMNCATSFWLVCCDIASLLHARIKQKGRVVRPLVRRGDYSLRGSGLVNRYAEQTRLRPLSSLNTACSMSLPSDTLMRYTFPRVIGMPVSGMLHTAST